MQISSPDVVVKGNVNGGDGTCAYDNFTSGAYVYNGDGGDIIIEAGNISGNISSGKSVRDEIGGYGNCGNIKINGGIVNITDYISVNGDGNGTPGVFSSDENGTAVITSNVVPDGSEFLSGIINCAGDITIYGTQNVTSEIYIDEYSFLVIHTGGNLILEDNVIRVDGGLTNNGTLTLKGNSDITGTGKLKTGASAKFYKVVDIDESMIYVPQDKV